MCAVIMNCNSFLTSRKSIRNRTSPVILGCREFHVAIALRQTQFMRMGTSLRHLPCLLRYSRTRAFREAYHTPSNYLMACCVRYSALQKMRGLMMRFIHTLHGRIGNKL